MMNGGMMYGYKKCPICGQTYLISKEHDCPVKAKLAIENLARLAEQDKVDWRIELDLPS